MRKHLLITIACIVLANLVFAQAPSNDNCSGLIDLGPAPVCPGTIFSNANASATDIGAFNAPACFPNGAPQHDVWFAFTCPDTLLDFRITLTAAGASPMQNPQLAIYRGDCQFDGLALLKCLEETAGGNAVTFDIQGLSGGIQYYLRVSDFTPPGSPAPNWGDFTLCVAPIPPIVTIDQGSSKLCNGTLFDSGGPNGDYKADEDFTFQICPDEPSQCITFTLEYYNLEETQFFGAGDYLTFFDGPDINSPLISTLGGAAAGGGGVCYKVQAQSGCLTVQFTSDETNEFEGWKGTWECSNKPCEPQEVFSVNTNIVNQDIVNAVNTPFTTVKVTNIQCPNGAYGTFQFATDNNALGLGKGLLLTSGRADNAIGPNDLASTGTDNFAIGDADLDYLSGVNGSQSKDACIVELDVFATSDELTFEYVFGSEEYPEFANDLYNDIFAFLISGPGITGDPGLGGAKNIAIIPGTNQPVQINSINSTVNWQYYRSNPFDAPSLQYDGLTSDSLGKKKSLTARSSVIPCNTYHLKLAIADRFDGMLDSGVFISEIKGGSPDIATAFDGNLPYLIEACSADSQKLTFTLPDPLTETLKYYINVSGTAVRDVDYTTTLSDSIVFAPGQTSISFYVSQIPDTESEGAETVIISLANNFGCGTVIFDTLTFEIKDNISVHITGGDTLQVCAGKEVAMEATGGVDYFWSPPGAVNNPFIANPTIKPTQSFWLKVEGKVGPCLDYDSIFIQVIDPKIEVFALADTNICLGASVPLQSINNINDEGLIWSPAEGLDDPKIANPIATPTKTTTYKATVERAGCPVSDMVTINVDTLFFPKLIADTVICQNYPVQLGNVLKSTTKYEWTPTTGLSDPNSSGPIATPDQTTVYTLTATSKHGFCTQTGVVKVTVTPSDVDILGKDSLEICLGTKVPLSAQSSPSGASITWSPSFYVSPAIGSNVTATLDESATIFAAYKINGCTVRDSVHIRVDSLPESKLALKPTKPIYCPGDTVIILSKTYEPANFPDIVHAWKPFEGQETDKDLWNMVITATKTHFFVRVTTNHACAVTDSILVPVDSIPVVMATASPANICPGETVQINATVVPDQKLKWQDNPLLSCTECKNPMAGPILNTTTFQVTTPDANCPGNGSVTVNVIPVPALNLAPSQPICLGDSVLINNVPIQPDVTYTWTASVGVPPIGTNPKVAPTVPTTYTITAQGPKCVSTGTVTITPVTASIDAGLDQSICFGETTTLTATSTGTPGGVTWEPGALAGNPVTVTPAATTIYTATLTYGPNCKATDKVVVNVNPAKLQLALPPNSAICLGDSILLNNSPAEPGVTYTWTASVGAVPVGANPKAKPTEATTYTLTATSAQCTKTATTTISVAFATVNAGLDQSICFGETAILTATATGTPGTITWTPDGFVGNPFNATPAATTIYTANLLYGPNCKASDPVTVTVNPAKLQLALPPNTAICLGDSIFLNSSPIEAGVTYTWTASVGAAPTGVNPKVKPGVTTTYKLTATSGQCTKTAETTITVASATVNAGPDQSICFGQTAALTAVSTGTPGGTFVWQPGGFSGNPFNVSPLQKTSYDVVMTYGPGCTATDAVIVDVKPVPTLSVITAKPKPSDSLFCEGRPVTLKVTVTPATAALTWFANGTLLPELTKDSVIVKPSGDNQKTAYTVVATTAAGCTATAGPVEFTSKRCFEIPNAFTPNGDALNNTFGIVEYGGDVAVELLTIYNRWGQKVFESFSKEKRWDGRFDGKDAPADVYAYIIRVRFANGETKEQKGDVTLLR